MRDVQVTRQESHESHESQDKSQTTMQTESFARTTYVIQMDRQAAARLVKEAPASQDTEFVACILQTATPPQFQIMACLGNVSLQHTEQNVECGR